MTQHFTMHALNPQPRLIRQAAEAILAGQLIAYPTDSGYAFGCALESKNALMQLRQLRGIDEKHPLTMLSHSISDASQYCYLDDNGFRILKAHTPGPYTFIFAATKQVPRLVQGTKRKVVGIRIPAHPVALALLQAVAKPILSSTLWLKDDEAPLSEPDDIMVKIKGKLDLMLDIGEMDNHPSTIVDLSGKQPQIIRRGMGDPSLFED